MSEHAISSINDDRTTAACATFPAFLLHRKAISEAALTRADGITTQSGEALVSVLIRLGLMAERELTEQLAVFLHIPIASPADFPTFPILHDRLSEQFLREMKIVPLSENGAVVRVAMSNPLDLYSISAVRFSLGREVGLCVAYPSDLEKALERLYGDGGTGDAFLRGRASAEKGATQEDDLERLREGTSDAPIIRLAQTIITRAVETGASDIHFEPMENDFRIRYRIDGILHEMERLPSQFGAPLISRVKVLAKLNIAERRLPQDGRIRLAVKGKDIDFRIATSPTTRGESVVLRILDRANVALDFERLGFDKTFISKIRETLRKPHGIILVTGPTGSGKTTTLYAALSEVNDPSRKILTIEDPVEYEIQGVNQVQVLPNVGITFASALRSFLRHDPDVMMIGEIRDKETAQVSVQAALTGHLILSTLHTNDVASAVTRLRDMGIEDYLLTSTIELVIAQRLIRTLCEICREPLFPSDELLSTWGVHGLQVEAPRKFFAAKGCSECNHTGYRGRTTIAEWMPVSPAIRRAILGDADAATIREVAKNEGMKEMRIDGVQKVARGITTIEEVTRVTQVKD